MKLSKYMYITVIILSFVSTKLYAYNAESKPPQNLGAYPSSAYGERLMPGTANTYTWSVGTTTLTGTGTAGFMGTNTVGADDYAGLRWNGTLGIWQIKGPATASWDQIATGTVNVVSSWVSGGVIGTGTMNVVAGNGISIVPTTDGAGNGTLTVNSSGTSSAGGWTDTGTQTVATSGYLVRLQGQLVLHADGISGLIDSMIPNTITLDNVTQITSRDLADMQGSVIDGQVNDNITLTNVTQITNRALADMQGTLDLGTQTTGTLAGTSVIPTANLIPRGDASGRVNNWVDYDNSIFGMGTDTLTVSATTTLNGVNYYQTVTINSGGTLTCSQGRPLYLFVSGTLTVNGDISVTGKGGDGGLGGNGAGTATGGIITCDGNNGGAGQISSTIAQAGSTITNAPIDYVYGFIHGERGAAGQANSGGGGGGGGSAGAGGNASGMTGGAAGSGGGGIGGAGSSTVGTFGAYPVITIHDSLSGSSTATTYDLDRYKVNPYGYFGLGGTGGGGGAGGGSGGGGRSDSFQCGGSGGNGGKGGSGGNGGNGGGIIYIYAKYIVNNNAIAAKGTNGAAGSTGMNGLNGGNANGGNSGGGGGGGAGCGGGGGGGGAGGWIKIVTTSLTGTGTVSVAGGAGGAAGGNGTAGTGGTGTGTGGNGGNGVNGGTQAAVGTAGNAGLYHLFIVK